MRRLPTLALILALCAPSLARADADDELGETLTTTGMAVFFGSYGLTVATATTLVIVANARDETIGASFYPVAGPWVMLADSAGFNDLQLFLTGASGVVQAASLGLVVAGLVLRHQSAEGSLGSGARVAPLVSPGLLGGVIQGRF